MTAAASPPKPSPRRRASPGHLRKERVSGGRLELSRLAPSGRSLLTGFLILATAIGLYAAARETSAFAVRQIAVEGTSPEVSAEVRKALAPALGISLLALDLDELAARAQAVPMVSAASFDRGFPNTLRIAVVPEMPVAVLRQGASSWLAAEGGRVVAELDRGARPGLPRIWLARDVDVRLGESLGGLPLRAVATVAPLVDRPLPLRVTSVIATKEELTLQLRSGIDLRLGNALDLAVKLEVARRILPAIAGEPGYLDVSVPDRPVSGTQAQAQLELETVETPLP